MERARVCVDVWAVPASTRPTVEQRSGLDEAERERAAALADGVSHRFVLGRVLLRAAVAARWECPPDRVALRSTCPVCGGAHGPVQVVGPGPATGSTTGAATRSGGTRPLHVSITRAGPLVAVALCTDAPVGIDAESRGAITAAPLADVALSPIEIAALPARVGRRRRALERAWVRKEAVLKALGTGLAVGPADVVLHRPTARPRGVDAVAAGDVAVADLRLGTGRVGAVAVVAPELAGRSASGGRRRPGALVVRRYDGVQLLAGRRS